MDSPVRKTPSPSIGFIAALLIALLLVPAASAQNGPVEEMKKNWEILLPSVGDADLRDADPMVREVQFPADRVRLKQFMAPVRRDRRPSGARASSAQSVPMGSLRRVRTSTFSTTATRRWASSI